MKFGPEIYGATETYRVEEFYQGKALDAKKVRDPVISRKIFARLAQMHLLKLNDIPKKPLILRVLEDKSMIIKPVLKKIAEGTWT